MLVTHTGGIEVANVGEEIARWLEAKGFQTERVAAGSNCIVSARKPDAGWKAKIGANPSLQIEIKSVPTGTEVNISADRESGGKWAARYLTYSWVAAGVTFVTLKKELEDLSRRAIEGGGAATAPPGVMEVVETGRVEQPLGSDQRRIDNSDSDATVSHTVEFTRRWRQTCSVQQDDTTATSVGLDIKAVDLVSLSSRAEQTLRRHYSLSTETEQTHTESVTLSIPARKAVRLVFDWKMVKQVGVVRVTDLAGTVEVPFEVELCLAFDQRLDDMC